ncbi:MAG TPA: hypothetical protein VK075_01375 [Pseudogracilibacillus sp.]|nr:hypothetical protein [Pseudogracilibacillus sp.]
MKYAYTTTGTTHFLQSLTEKHAQHDYTFMKNINNTLVYYETSTKRSIFTAGNKYDILHAYRSLPNQGFVVIQHIPIAKDALKSFQSKLTHTFENVTLTSGLECARILKVRRKSECHIFTFWEKEADYDLWLKEQNDQDPFLSLVRQPAYFAERAFKSRYYILSDEEDET